MFCSIRSRSKRAKGLKRKYWLHMGKDASGKESDSQLCQFKEHILAFVRTQPVAIISFDPILHNPHFFTANRGSIFNVAMPTANREIDHTLLRGQGVGLPYQCDVHTHMSGYIAGFDHPYFAITDSAGKFEIPACAGDLYARGPRMKGQDEKTVASSGI